MTENKFGIGEREIEFRAWDNKSNKMILVTNYLNFGDNSIWNHDDRWIHNCQEWSNEEGYYDDTVLMQYTGLKDKSGKKIYEGDIVKYFSYYCGDHKYDAGIDCVHYDDGCFFGGNGELDSVMIYNKEIEVIGNIFNNPELLN